MIKSKIFIIIVICVITLIIFILNNKYEGFKNAIKESSTLILFTNPNFNSKNVKLN
ncbi:uncharacterized protein METZ01_LOCUS141292 [marine metagenome]|uniref:Uncharacterized protein n=1 Tax=marine metagenome TaxID=408172 RepID=A0A381ZGJ6_9ZZZZ